MHQSPQKQLAGRRGKHAALDFGDAEAERRLSRGAQPKARKFPLRDETQREPRPGGRPSRG